MPDTNEVVEDGDVTACVIVGPTRQREREAGAGMMLGWCWAGPDGLARAGPVLFFLTTFSLFPFLCFEN